VGARLALVVAALALAALTWRFVEQPWRRGPTERPWWKLAGFAAASLAVLAIGVGLFATGGAPARLSPAARAAAALETQDVNPLRHACFDHPGPIAPTGCRIGAAADAKTYDVLVWGDSHADAVTPGVAAWAQARGWSVREAAIGGCPPLIGVRLKIVNGPARPECEQSSEEVLGEVAANPKLKLVVLMARWTLYRDQPPFYDPNSPRVRMQVDGQRDGPPNLAPPLARTLDGIHQRNPTTRIVVIGPVPELTITPPECLAQARHLHRPEAFCWNAPAGPPLARARPAEAEIASALRGRPWAKLVLPSAQLCDARVCVAALDGRPTYFDDDHLSASGARRLIPGWLEAALGPPPGTSGSRR
jgi:hypothetical protein